MSPRKRILAFALALFALPGPGFADDSGKGVKVDAKYAGLIIGSSLFQELSDGKSDSPGGGGTPTGPQVPQLIDGICEISNQLGEHHSMSWGGGGGSAQATGWRVSPITVCVSGFAVWGPTPVVVVTLPRTCDSLVA